MPQLSIRAATVLCAAIEQRSHNQTCGSKRKVIRTEHFVAAHVTIDNESRGHTRGWRRISAAFNILARKYAQAFTRAPKKPNLIVPAFPQERCSGSATQSVPGRAKTTTTLFTEFVAQCAARDRLAVGPRPAQHDVTTPTCIRIAASGGPTLYSRCVIIRLSSTFCPSWPQWTDVNPNDDTPITSPLDAT